EKILALSSERARALEELRRVMRENEGLHAQLLEQAREAGVADERQRLAREIHDTVAQGLIGVITQLEAGRGADAPERLRRIENAMRIARESLVEARRAVQAATPTALEGRKLHQALEEVARSWSSLQRVPASFTVTGEPRDLHPEVEVSVLRVAQEALANVARHARASRVAVTLSYMGDVVTLDVRDDGVGFAPGSEGGGFGLAGMRARAEELGGSVHLESEPGRGTAVCLELPTVAPRYAS
ncbi:MAG TPA: sensor histidine kinase, partial [Trueperaceae bacterium]|nr:sensor histidine kinase [Trueperaceae bacterium]